MKDWKRGAALLAALALSLSLMGCGGDQSSDGEWEGGSAPLESTELEATDDSYEDDWEFEPTEGEWESGPELDSETESFSSGPPIYTFSDGMLTCSGGGSVYYGDLKDGWSQVVAIALFETDKDIIRSAVKKVVVEDRIWGIGDYAFDQCTNLTEVILPDSLNSIGDQAFARTSLTNIQLPSSLTHLGDFALAKSPLTEIILPDELTYLGVQTFQGCPITKLTIPASVTGFSVYWLELDHTPSLNELTFEGDLTIDQIESVLSSLMRAESPLSIRAHSGTVIEGWVTRELAERGSSCNVTFVAL